jgi:hypothetical protein
MADTTDFSDIFQLGDENLESVPEAETQSLRTGFQGLSLGFGDEIEAAVRSVLPESLGGGEYETLRDEVRTKLREYKAQNPKRALTEEIVGGVLSMFLPGGAVAQGGRGAGFLANLAARLPGMAGRGVAESTVATVGYSDEDKEDLVSGLGNTLSTAGTIGLGTGASVGLGVGLSALSPLGGKLAKIIKNQFGNAPANAVQEELMRIMEQTGKSLDEVVQDIRDGRTLSSNEDLVTAIKALQLDTPATIQLIKEGAKRQGDKTRKALDESLEGALVPDAMGGNIFTVWRKKITGWKKQEKELYKELFETTNPDVPDNIANEMLDAIDSFEGAGASLAKIFKARKIPPLFKDVDGEIVLTRKPTLEDAEILRRSLAEATTKGFKEGEGIFANILREKEEALRAGIDEFSPELKRTRTGYRELQDSVEAFEYGEKKALTGKVEEVIDNIKDYTESQFEAFRAGVLANVRNQISKTPGTTLQKLYDETTQLGTILRIVVPEDQIDDILWNVDTARNAQVIRSKSPTTAGSLSTPINEELKRVGQGIATSGARLAMFGDPSSAISLVSNVLSIISPAAKKMKPAERLEVAKIIFSEDADLVEKVLNQSVDYTVLLDKVAPAMDQVSKLLSRLGVQQTVQPTVPEEKRPIVPRTGEAVPVPDTLSSIPPMPGITPGPENQISAASGPFNPETYARLFPNDGIA